MKYSQTLIDDEFEISNIATVELRIKKYFWELRSISGNINFTHTTYVAIPIYQLLNILWTSLPLTQIFLRIYITGIICR